MLPSVSISLLAIPGCQSGSVLKPPMSFQMASGVAGKFDDRLTLDMALLLFVRSPELNPPALNRLRASLDDLLDLIIVARMYAIVRSPCFSNFKNYQRICVQTTGVFG